MIEDLNPQMGHSHFIDIGKGKTELQPDPGRVLSNRIELLAKIPNRF
jgi:hypothetical protein